MLNRLIIALWLLAQRQAPSGNIDTATHSITYKPASLLYRVALALWDKAQTAN